MILPAHMNRGLYPGSTRQAQDSTVAEAGTVAGEAGSDQFMKSSHSPELHFYRPLPSPRPQREISFQEVLQGSDHSNLSLRVSSREVPNPAYAEETGRIRKVIQTALENEDLLARFILLDDPWELHRNHIPPLVNDLVARSGVQMNEEEKEYLSGLLGQGDYRTIDLYVENSQDENLYRAISKFSDSYFQTKYALTTIRKAQELIQQYFPGLYREFPLKTIVLEIPNYENASHSVSKEGPHRLALYTSDSLASQRSFESLETQGVFEKGYRFRRKTADLLTLIHEYAHGIYTEITNPSRLESKGEYYKTVDAALNEGFAVFMELLAADKMVCHAKELGLDERDIRDLQEHKKQRLSSLRRKFTLWKSKDPEAREKASPGMAYTEGTLIMRQIFRTGGMEAVSTFLQRIDPQKTLSILRTDEEYRRRLLHPEQLQRLVDRDEIREQAA